MKIAFGADHAGYELKQHLIEVACGLGHTVTDLGTHSRDSVDYPDYGEAVGRAVVAGEVETGVVICSNGVGISITANKVPGVRCALCHSTWGAARARQHADANVLAMGSLEIGQGVAEEVLKAFLSNEFEGGRHTRRLAKMRDVEARGIGAELSTP